MGGRNRWPTPSRTSPAENIAETFLYPPEQPFPKTPADYGIDYIDVEFPARDGLTLSGWLLNGGQETAIIMTHFGYRANRYGYQTRHQPRLTRPYGEEIEFVRVARHLVDAGYTVLMYDMRNHGLSAKNANGCGTGGVEERFDVLGAIEYAAALDGTEQVGLLSYCMGLNATFFAAGENARAFTRNKVKALVGMQPLRNGDFIHAMGGIPDKLYDEAEEHFTAQTGCSLNPEIINDIAPGPGPHPAPPGPQGPMDQPRLHQRDLRQPWDVTPTTGPGSSRRWSGWKTPSTASMGTTGSLTTPNPWCAGSRPTSILPNLHDPNPRRFYPTPSPQPGHPRGVPRSC